MTLGCGNFFLGGGGGGGIILLLCGLKIAVNISLLSGIENR